MAEKTLTIEERLALLDEASQFFADLGEAGETSERLGRLKAAALSTVKECLDLYQEKMLDGEERTEETLETGLSLSISKDRIEDMIKSRGMTEKEANFYRGGFGLAIGILEGDPEQIDGLKKLQAEYDEIVEMKLSNKTISDLLK